jgi:hypothetical protein
MDLNLHRPVTAVAYALVIVAVTFVWAGFVANVPALRDVGGVPLIVHNPVVALPILGAWTVLSVMLARHYLTGAPNPSAEGITLGLVFVAAAAVFDAVVVAGIVGEGLRHFAQLVVWVGYAVLVLAPWWVGRSLGISRNTD